MKITEDFQPTLSLSPLSLFLSLFLTHTHTLSLCRVPLYRMERSMKDVWTMRYTRQLLQEKYSGESAKTGDPRANPEPLTDYLDVRKINTVIVYIYVAAFHSDILAREGENGRIVNMRGMASATRLCKVK